MRPMRIWRTYHLRVTSHEYNIVWYVYSLGLTIIRYDITVKKIIFSDYAHSSVYITFLDLFIHVGIL